MRIRELVVSGCLPVQLMSTSKISLRHAPPRHRPPKALAIAPTRKVLSIGSGVAKSVRAEIHGAPLAPVVL